MDWYKRISLRTYIFIGIVAIAVFALILYAMGRVPMCECGYIKLWHGIIQSSENSQHILDWYSFSHIIHGFAFYFFLWRIGKKWPIGLRLVLVIFLETSWEIFENTDFVINRYRTATISLDYYGDSIINSVSDSLLTIVGFVLAYRLPVLTLLVLAFAMEVFMLYWLRDNLTLNIIMLIYPLDFMRDWQGGG